MTKDPDVIEIQKLYPRIYMACHTEHQRAASSEHGLSARDSSVLAHLSHNSFTSPSRLARHLNVAKPTVSEALSKLQELGFVREETDLEDGRRKCFQLTQTGIDALSESSVLDYGKLAAALTNVNSQKRKLIIDGLTALVEATRSNQIRSASGLECPS